MRNGVKYVCRYCNGEHYTKADAESCFNNHFDEKGLEKD
jgi:hypothetical protein